MKMIKALNIYGAGGHARVIIDIIHSRENEEIGFVFDENPELNEISNYKISNQWLTEYTKENATVICIGDNSIRKKIARNISEEIAPYLAHRSAIISPTSRIGDGTVIMANTSINPEVIIGQHCIINTSAVVEHQATIEDYAHIAPSAAIAGQVLIGRGAHVGINACIVQNIKIGKWASIGAGAVIIEDVPDFAVVVGNPGKIIKFSNE